MSTVQAYLTAKIAEELRDMIVNAVADVQPDAESTILSAVQNIISAVENDIITNQVSNISATLATNILPALQSAVEQASNNAISNIDYSTISSTVANNLIEALNAEISNSVVPTFVGALNSALSTQAPDVASQILTNISSLIIESAQSDLNLSVTFSTINDNVLDAINRIGDPSADGIVTLSNGIKTLINRTSTVGITNPDTGSAFTDLPSLLAWVVGKIVSLEQGLASVTQTVNEIYNYVTG